MKKLVMAFLLVLSVVTFGQEQNYYQLKNGAFWQDSLWKSIYVVGSDTTAANLAVSSVELTLNWEYEWGTLVTIDTGAVYTDSVRIWSIVYSTIPYGNGYKITDSVLTPISFTRDTTWTNVTNLLVRNNATTTYKLYLADTYKIRISLVNAQAITNRVWRFILMLSRKTISER